VHTAVVLQGGGALGAYEYGSPGMDVDGLRH
jgi:hypothetical protein